MNLKRFGKNIDFENDGSFDPGTETIRTDVPRGSKRKVKNGGDYTHYNGTEYEIRSRTPLYLKERNNILRILTFIQLEQFLKLKTKMQWICMK